MYDNWIILVIGLVLIVAGSFGKGFTPGMAPHRGEPPRYPMTRQLRIVLYMFGLLAAAGGLYGLLRKP